MGKEIERKFLVTDQSYKALAKPVHYIQGYLISHKDRVVRIRIAGDEGFITVKGAANGATRSEFEYGIPLEDASEMLSFCEKPIIEKYRYTLDYEGFTWEIDEFLRENEGLCVAEIELPSEDAEFIKPAWISREVTGDLRYYNNNLIKNPFRNWSSQL